MNLPTREEAKEAVEMYEKCGILNGVYTKKIAIILMSAYSSGTLIEARTEDKSKPMSETEEQAYRESD
jgi:hypothetical protein